MPEDDDICSMFTNK